MVNKTSVKIVLIFVALVALMALGFYIKEKLFKSPPQKIPENIITSNPFFETEDFLGWEGNYYKYPSLRVPQGSNHLGIVTIHPRDVDTPSYIGREVSLSANDNYVLKASVGNIAGLTEFAGPCGGADVIIRIKIVDKSTNTEETLFDGIVKPEDGWMELSYDISRYAGKTIEFRAEGVAGGPGGNWCGEWAALDYFYIEKIE